MGETRQLNIKNPRAYEAAAEIAELTGEGLTAAVVTALEERLERERRKAARAGVAAALMDIGCRYSAEPDRDTRSPEEIIGYDENGLPT